MNSWIINKFIYGLIILKIHPGLYPKPSWQFTKKAN
jgi:hypothetical protein